MVDALEESVERLRVLAREHPDKLVLVEDLPPKADAAEVVVRLGREPRDAEAFKKYHAADWGRWRGKKKAAAAKEKDALPRSYARFVERYGSLTLLANDKAGIEASWARYVGNVGHNGWGLLTLLNGARRKYMTSFFRDYDVDEDELHEYGLDRVIVFAGFANDATAFDTRRRNKAGDYAIVSLDEDQIFGGTPAEDDIEAGETIEPFDAWLARRVKLIEGLFEVRAPTPAKKPAVTVSPEELKEILDAMDRDDDAAVLAIFAAHPERVHARTERGSSLLMCAAHRNRVALLEPLVELGLDVNEARGDRVTALMMTAQTGSLAAAEWLLDHGADVNARTEHGSMAAWAIECKQPAVARLALDRGFKPTVDDLHLAAARNDVEIAAMLLDHGAPTEDPTSDYPPLHSAVVPSAKDWPTTVAKLLIERGADIHGLNKSGNTPLHTAAYQDNLAGVSLLVKMGARVDEPNKKGDTALHVAAREERVEVVPLLLKLGANPGAKNAKGQTPLGVVPKKGAAYSNSVRREAVIAALKTAK